jgi:hypothetical protein
MTDQPGERLTMSRARINPEMLKLLRNERRCAVSR